MYLFWTQLNFISIISQISIFYYDFCMYLHTYIYTFIYILTIICPFFTNRIAVYIYIYIYIYIYTYFIYY